MSDFDGTKITFKEIDLDRYPNIAEAIEDFNGKMESIAAREPILTFTKGTLIQVKERDKQSGMCFGEYERKLEPLSPFLPSSNYEKTSGWFPTEFVEFVPISIGKGSFGVVYSGLWNSQQVAVKQLFLKDKKQKAILWKEFRREVWLMRYHQVLHFF